jgi:tetratricopeptide (TPR) repeat protein
MNINKISNFKKISAFTIASIIILSVAAEPKKALPLTEVNGLPISNVEQTTVATVQAAIASLNKGRWANANRLFTSLTETNPQAAIGWIGQSRSANSLVESTNALKMAKKVVESSSAFEKQYIALQDAYMSSDSKAKHEISLKLVADFPGSSLVWIERGYVLEDHKKIDQARMAYTNAAKAAPYDIGSLLASGDSYLFSEPKDMVKAETYYQKAVNLAPTDAWAHIKLGDVHRAQQNLQLSYQDYTRASLLDPNDSIAMNKRGHVNSFLGNYEQARKDFSRAVKISADMSNVFNNSGNFTAFTHLYDNKPKKALQALEAHLAELKTVDLEDHQKREASIFTLSNLSKIALHNELLDKANGYINAREDLINNIVATMDNKELVRKIRAELHFYKGQLQAREGQIETALQSADKMRLLLESVKDDRKLEDYHELQALISIKKEQWSQAISHYENADQDKLYVKFHHAVALEQSGDIKKAKKLFTEVAQYNFNSVDFALLRNSAVKKLNLQTVASLH